MGGFIAGEELSSVGSRHPEKVAELIYLDAGYDYAYYDRERGSLDLDALEVQRKLEQLQPGKGPADQRPLMHELLNDSLPQLKKQLREALKSLEVVRKYQNAIQFPYGGASAATASGFLQTAPLKIRLTRVRGDS